MTPPLEAPVTPTPAAVSAVPPEVLRASFGQVLLKAARLYNELAIARVQRERDPRIRLAHTTLFPHLSLSGIRPTDLAKRVGVSKQAVAPLVDDLLDWGMLERVDDPADGRAWLVRLTPEGGAAILDGLKILGGIEAKLRAELGDERMSALHGALSDTMDLLERDLGLAGLP